VTYVGVTYVGVTIFRVKLSESVFIVFCPLSPWFSVHW
jgi:hypothetical protein